MALRRFTLITLLLVLLAAVACQPAAPTPDPSDQPTAVAPSEVAVAPTEPTETEPDPTLATPYDLGEATIIQNRFDEDSRFRNMPVRLNGLIAAPASVGPHPVVVIMHGTHPGCPVNEMSVDVWPCAIEDEQPNYSGFDYLVSGLAEAGYVALSVNINAENTFGFGEPIGAERLAQLLQYHLAALETASSGGENGFGVELNGRADLSRVVLVGHSRGGENAYWLTHQQEWDVFPQGNESIAGVLLVAAAVVSLPLDNTAVPVANVLPVCDGDVVSLDGQFFYELNRLDPNHSSWAASVLLAQANHNHFNSILSDERLSPRTDRPDCETLLEPEVQRQFLVDYAVDFLTVLFAEEADEVAQAQANLGLDVTAVAPSELYGLPARVAFQPPADKRQTLFVPRTADELNTNALGGTVTAENVDTTFCPDGFYTLESMPATEACHRTTVTVPGQPAHAVLAWSAPGSAWRLGLPQGQGDLSSYTTLSLRVVADPLTLTEPLLFSLQLTDTAGNTAVVALSPDEPAIQLPAGAVREDEFFPAGVFSGIAPLLTVHVPLADFAGVDRAQVSEVALLFDQTPSGAIFLADVAATRP